MYFLNRYKEEIISRSTEIKSSDSEKPPIIHYLNYSILCGEYFSSKDNESYYSEFFNLLTSIDDILDAEEEKLDAEKSKNINAGGTIQTEDKSTTGDGKKSTAETLTENLQKITALIKTLPRIEQLKRRIHFFKKVNLLFLSLAKKARNDLREFKVIEDYYESNTVFEINLLEELNKHEYKEIENSIELQEDLFKVNIALAEHDLYLDSHDETINKLRAYEKFLLKIEALKAATTKDITPILIDKCRFLLFKIYLRKYLQVKKEDGFVGDDNFNINLVNKIENGIFFFREFSQRAIDHYYKEIYNTTALLPKLESDKNCIFSIQELHTLNKYFRKNSNTYGLNNIYLNLEQKKLKGSINYESPSFNDIAQLSALNLIRNSKLRLFLEPPGGNDFENCLGSLSLNNKKDILDNLLLPPDLTVILKESIQNDYYPYKIYLNYIERLLDYLILNPKKLIEKDKYKEAEGGKDISSYITENLTGDTGCLKRIESIIDAIYPKFRNNLTFYKYKKIKPLYPKFEECRITLSPELLQDISLNEEDKNNLNLFSESGYILPDDYSSIETDFKGIKGRLKNKIATIKNLLIVDNKINFFEKSFKKEVENKEFKLVQALAMFITISTLILGTIKAFENRDLISSLCIILGLACALLLFNYFIYWFIRSNKKFTIREIVFLLVLGISIAITINFSSKRDVINSSLQHTTDSLKLFSTYDSLIKNKKVILFIPDSLNR